MEDILASIKRVIAEDPRPIARGGQPRIEPEEADEDDVLELDQPIVAEVFAGTESEPLVSRDAMDATRNSLAALDALRPATAAPIADEGPLEAVVRDMLRPMLKDWLDQRLPAIVEELVAREVARITGKR